MSHYRYILGIQSFANMDSGASIVKADVEGNTPLSKAKTIEIANLIKAKPVEEMKKKYGMDENAFVLACAKNDIEDVKILIASGEDVNQYGMYIKFYCTPINTI